MTGVQTKLFQITMTVLFLLVSAFLITGLHASPQAEAEPISCADADEPSDYAICNSETLLLLDEELSQIAQQRFSRLETESEREGFRSAQIDWTNDRSACGANAECLKAHYLLRLREIRGVDTASITNFKRFARTGNSI